jgi:hypothetical protein
VKRSSSFNAAHTDHLPAGTDRTHMAPKQEIPSQKTVYESGAALDGTAFKGFLR